MRRTTSASIAFVLVAWGCGQDADRSPNDVGNDSSVGFARPDAAIDTGVWWALDSGTHVDTGVDASPDTGQPEVDAGIDAGPPDAGMDAALVEATGGTITGEGFVLLVADSDNGIVSMQTTLVVPEQPLPSGTLFLWPGLQPGGANYLPIDNGVLQPVLTWGPSCAPGNQPPDYTTWWVSAQYVNTFGDEPGYEGCLGGDVMSVGVDDELVMTMTLSGNIWKQTVLDVQTQKQVSFDIDMKGQAQNRAEWVIEGYSSSPVSDVVFNDTTIVFAEPAEDSCVPVRRGQHDFMSMPVPSADGLTCFIKQVILRQP